MYIEYVLCLRQSTNYECIVFKFLNIVFYGYKHYICTYRKVTLHLA